MFENRKERVGILYNTIPAAFQTYFFKSGSVLSYTYPYCLVGSTEPLGLGFCRLVILRNVPLALKPISKAALFADRVSGTNKHGDSTQSPTITQRATQSPRA